MHPANQDIVEAVRTLGIFRRVFVLDSVDSTNNFGLAYCRDPMAELPAVVLAWEQLEGRGQRGRSWHSSAGSLTFSVMLKGSDTNLAQSALVIPSVGTALAVREAIAQAIPDGTTNLKWPNDVFLNGRKVAGILIETVPHPERRFVIGIGINVNNDVGCESADSWPHGQSERTSLRREAGAEVPLTALFLDVVQRTMAVFGDRRISLPALAAHWNTNCFLSGRAVVVESAGDSITGRAQGLSPEGHLVLATASGVVEITHGTVISWGM